MSTARERLRNVLDEYGEVQAIDCVVNCDDLRTVLAALEAAEALESQWQLTSEQWRKCAVAWQEWAATLLRDLGRQPDGGELGDATARSAIAAEVARLREALTEVQQWRHHAVGLAPMPKTDAGTLGNRISAALAPKETP